MKRCRRNIPLEICFVETLVVSGFNYFRRRSFIQYMYEGNKTFLAFLLRARGINNQWRIQRRSQIEKLVVVSVRSNLPQKSSTLFSEPKFGLPQSIFPGLVRRWQLIIWRLNYKWLSFPPNQTSLDKKASKLFTQIRALGSLFVTTMFASRLGSSLRSKRFQSSYCAKVRAEAKKRWNWGAMNHVLTFKRQTFRKLRYLSVRQATKFN